MPFHVIPGTPNPERIDGTQHRDLITGDAGNDTLGGWGGNDRILGEVGNDQIWGSFGSDTLFGGVGDDTITGAEYDHGDTDDLYGGAGNDHLFTGEVVNHSFGGAGDDTVTLYFDLGGTAQGGTGRDTLVMNYIGSSLSVTGVNADVMVDFNHGATVGAQSMSLAGFEQLQITTYSGNDTVTGSRGDDRIDVYTGANRVAARGGDDVVGYRTGAVNDLDGGEGRDQLRVGQEAQTGALNLVVTDTGATDGYGSILTGFEAWRVWGNSLDDYAQTGAARDFIWGADGDDTCLGMGGNDRIFGAEGQDSLDGGAGDDGLSGGFGLDVLTGGSGADSFHFGSVAGFGDTITDMQTGEDQLLLEARLFDGLTPGTLDPTRFQLEVAVGTAGQFVYRSAFSLGDGVLLWDANGSDAGGEVLVARLSGMAVLAAGDLILLG